MGYVVGFSLFFLAMILLVAYLLINAHLRWRAHPTMDQYLSEHPACKTPNGVKCAKCGAGSIRNWGVRNASDPRRLFICNHCGEHLYRSA